MVGLGALEDQVQCTTAVPVALLQQRGSVEVQQVEDHELDPGLFRLTFDVGFLRQLHPRLQEAEIGPAGLVNGNDFPVQYDGVVAQDLRQLFELRVGNGEIVVVAAGEGESALIDGGGGSDAVPFHLEAPAVPIVDVLDGSVLGHHGYDLRRALARIITGKGSIGAGGARGGLVSRAVAVVVPVSVTPALAPGRLGPGALSAGRLGTRSRLIFHQVDQPVVLGPFAAAGMDQRILTGTAQAAILLAIERDDHFLAITPLLQLVRSGVPDGDVSAAVFALRDRSLEAAVLHRMIFGLDRKVVLVRAGGNALGDGPGDQDAIVFEPEVIVQPCGVVFLDDESVARLGAGDFIRDRLRRLVRIAHAPVLMQAVEGVGCRGFFLVRLLSGRDVGSPRRLLCARLTGADTAAILGLFDGGPELTG